MDLQRGDRVRHGTFGTGVVQRKLGLQVVRIVFDQAPYLSRRLPSAELESLVDPAAGRAAEHDGNGARRLGLPPTAAVPRPSPPAPPAATTLLARNDAWQTLEALRLGVVPARGIRDYTVARERELENLAALLDAGRGCRVLWGDYGAGKTHLLEAAEQLALEEGFATARVTLDPREKALHHPLRLYRHIVESLRTSDRVDSGFEGLFERLAESPDHHLPTGARASRFFSPYLHALRRGNSEEIGWLRDYVRGDNLGSDEVNAVLSGLGWSGANVLRMSDFRTYGRMYVHLVGTLACWCADAGTRGVVLLFDEVERIDVLSSVDQRYAFEVLKHYAAVTMRRDDLAFDPESLYKGGHGVHRALPLRFREAQPLVSVFALTPLEEIRERFTALTSESIYDLHLSALEPGLLPGLVQRIAVLYERAYPGHEVSGDARNAACRRLAEAYDGGHDSFRDAVQATVFLLDGDRFRGAEPGTG